MKSKRQRTAELLNELRPCRAGYAYDKWFELVVLLAPSDANTRRKFLILSRYGLVVDNRGAVIIPKPNKE